MTTVISVEHLSKSYRLGQIGTGTFSNDLKVWWAKTRGKPNPLLRIGEVDHGNRDDETIWALKDISFMVEQGEVLGIIGRNGAGKSTLLKIFSRVTAPTSGKIKVKGRIASLLEVGTGFHPDLTGRENIYLNGSILGMTREEVCRKFDEIVAFSEVEKFIDTPVKRYSSGMYVRLAFAVAAHLEPEILIVDEVLAVGDAEFQKKCLGKMSDVANEGRTVLFVSHNLRAIQNLCSTSLLIKNGRLSLKSKSEEVINEYLSNIIEKSNPPLAQRVDRTGDGLFRFTDLTFNNRNKNVIKCGEKLDIIIGYEVKQRVENADISIGFFDITGVRVLYLGNIVAGTNIDYLPDRKKVVCSLKKFPLLPGKYTLNLYCMINNNLSDWVKEAAILVVNEGDFYGSGQLPPIGYGYTAVEQEWKIIND
jgi:lipopolysaccharide transport system ATP-binding protein